jgi:hypothetical protein
MNRSCVPYWNGVTGPTKYIFTDQGKLLVFLEPNHNCHKIHYDVHDELPFVHKPSRLFAECRRKAGLGRRRGFFRLFIANRIIRPLAEDLTVSCLGTINDLRRRSTMKPITKVTIPIYFLSEMAA